MKRLLSSRITFYWKDIFTIVWITGMSIGALCILFGSGTLTSSNGKPVPPAAVVFFKWQFCIMSLFGAVFLLWASAPLKRVFIDENWLHVSNYCYEAFIPLTDIVGVRENRLVHIGGKHRIIIELREASRFGKFVIFIPTGKAPFSWPWKRIDHPVLAELKAIAERNRSAAASDGPRGQRS